MDNSNKYRKQEAIKDALFLIKQNGGQMRSGDVFEEMAKSFPVSEYEKEKTKSGSERWVNWLSFYSIDAVKTGFLVKDKGVWHITSEGESALSLSNEKFAEALKDGYNRWYNENHSDERPLNSEPEQEIDRVVEIDVVQAQATNGIRKYINGKNPYEFQKIVAALFRAMGYYTPFIAPKGKDGGIDVIAYRDPLGTLFPRLKIQVKHYPNTPISVDVVRSLIGVLAKEGEVGIVVTSGTFTNEARREARNSHTPLRLIDIDEFISLWLQYYSNMSEEDKLFMPILPIYFIKPNNASDI